MPSQSASQNRAAEGPPVLRFKAQLILQAQPAKPASTVLLQIPKAVSAKLAGMNRVEGTINGHPFRAALKGGGTADCTLTANQAMLLGSKAKPGDAVELAILGPEGELRVPPDLQTALAGSKPATKLWQQLGAEVQRDWVRWVEGAKKAETRARRVTRTVEQLAEGKHRPCCVNFYEYALCRIAED